MPESLALDPEFETILREVASQPSSFLGLPSPLIVDAFFKDSRLSTSSAGLSLAERELLTAYRNDVAWLLRQACLRKLVEGDGKFLVSRYITPNEESHVLAASCMQSEIEALRSARPARPALDDPDPLAVLEACVTSPHRDEPSIASLAAASFRLEPTNEARLLASIGLICAERADSALQLARVALHCSPTPSQRITALQCAATVHAKHGSYTLAREASKQATDVDGTRPQSPMNWFACALQAGDRREVFDAARFLEACCSPNDHALNWFVASLTSGRARGRWAVSDEGRQLAGKLGPTFGPSVTRISHVFE